MTWAGRSSSMRNQCFVFSGIKMSFTQSLTGLTENNELSLHKFCSGDFLPPGAGWLGGVPASATHEPSGVVRQPCPATLALASPDGAPAPLTPSDAAGMPVDLWLSAPCILVPGQAPPAGSSGTRAVTGAVVQGRGTEGSGVDNCLRAECTVLLLDLGSLECDVRTPEDQGWKSGVTQTLAPLVML